MKRYVENINSSTHLPVVQVNSIGGVTPVEIYIQDLTLRSRQERYRGETPHILHSSPTTYKGDRLSVKEFLSAESSKYQDRPFYLALPENQKQVDMGIEILPLLSDCFHGLWPCTNNLDEFIDDFSNELLRYAVDNYTTVPDENGEDPLAGLHNDLQPFWSDATTTPIHKGLMEIGEKGSTGEVLTYLLYQTKDGVWTIDKFREEHETASVPVPKNCKSDVVCITLYHNKRDSNAWIPKPIPSFNRFTVKRYTL